jgi:hypothetical protein
MLGRNKAGDLPQARVVRGKHALAWGEASGGTRGPKKQLEPGAVTYERAMHQGSVAVLCGLWPLFAVAAMGIALLWTGTVYGTP